MKEAARTADVSTRPQAKREAAVHAARLNAENPFYNPEYVSPNVQRKRSPVPKGSITSRTPPKSRRRTKTPTEQICVISLLLERSSLAPFSQTWNLEREDDFPQTHRFFLGSTFWTSIWSGNRADVQRALCIWY